jgi:hypothetical protein
LPGKIILLYHTGTSGAGSGSIWIGSINEGGAKFNVAYPFKLENFADFAIV